MADNKLHLIKLCVGVNSVQELLDWREKQAKRLAAVGEEYISSHVTRMWPKRADEILNGGSIYWVIKGQIQARQQILGFDESRKGDGIRRCRIMLSPQLVRTQIVARRPFQGWRYLADTDTPPDMVHGRTHDDDIPVAMNLALAEIGLR